MLVDDRGQPLRADAHVWHCSLSLHPDEQALEDDKWSEIAREFIQEMGFSGQRWVAMRHGLTKNGGDHIHLVVQLVGEDGRSANVHNDRPRAQEACRKLEREHGLRLVEGRDRKRGARATKYRQRYRAEREHRNELRSSPEPDREILERIVRRLAAASRSEGEFVRRLCAEGLIVRPRFAASRDDQIVGYSVALTPADGKPVVPPSERGAWAQTAAEGAAVLLRVGRARQRARARAQRARARAGAERRDPRRRGGARAASPHPRSVAVLCAAMMRPSNQTLFWLALAQELQALAVAIHDMHQAAGEAQRAAQLAEAIHSQLAPLATRLDDEHAAADPGYAEARQSLRLTRVGQAPVRDITRRPPPPTPTAKPAPRPDRERKPGLGPP